MSICIRNIDTLPFRINNECIKNREARISIDLVKDEVRTILIEIITMIIIKSIKLILTFERI